jgi:hypothetical protein
MVFALLRAKKKRSPNRRWILTTMAGNGSVNLSRVSQRLPERLRFGGLFLCLNDSWLIDRVRGSRFRAARGRREDFAKADRQFQKRTDRAGLARFEPENRKALVVGIRRANTNVKVQEVADCI